jgi:hypothetical protein
VGARALGEVERDGGEGRGGGERWWPCWIEEQQVGGDARHGPDPESSMHGGPWPWRRVVAGDEDGPVLGAYASN